jgi:hypothetical protein
MLVIYCAILGVTIFVHGLGWRSSKPNLANPSLVELPRIPAARARSTLRSDYYGPSRGIGLHDGDTSKGEESM